MNAIEILRTGLHWAHEILQMTVADVTPEMAHKEPGGIANSIAASYAHAIVREDGVLNGTLRGKTPLFSSSWVGKTGVSDPQVQSSTEWAKWVKVDLAALAEYARAVAAESDTYISTLTEADLDRKVDLSSAGLGERTLGWALNALVIGHIHNMVGEISALKGTQGAKGYPF